MNDTIQVIKIFFASFAGDLPGLFIMIFGLIFTLTAMINGGIILPLIFNFMIIPEIEKKIGQKLEYWPMWQRVPFWKFNCPHLEVAQYIFFQYLTKKAKINFAYFIPRDYALKKVNYDIRRASRFELVMSFIAAINFCLTFISVVIGLLIAHYYNIH